MKTLILKRLWPSQYLLDHYSRVQGSGAISAQEARRNGSILLASWRSLTNFAKLLPAAEFSRNSGMVWRIALATTSSEGGMPGRMVRSQEPKEAQTRCGNAAARYCSSPWQTTAAWMKTW